jgi:hypothetical protein
MFKNSKLEEADFDLMVSNAGGTKFKKYETNEKGLSPDYLFGDDILELKTLESDGVSVETRHEKIFNIFEKHFPKWPVIPITLSFLDDNEKREYFEIISNSIVKRLQKANKQLRDKSKEIRNTKGRFVLLINNGFTSLMHEELVVNFA